MERAAEGVITELLLAWSEGSEQALEELLPLVHQHLSRQAASYLRRERQGHTLQTQALVNEAFLALVRQDRVRWRDRAHFFAVAAQAMRRILVDSARSKKYQKRGAGAQSLPLEEVALFARERPVDVLALDEALRELAKAAPERARMVELRYFGGLNKEEIAAVLSISPATVSRWWQICRAWLYSYIVEGKRLGL